MRKNDLRNFMITPESSAGRVSFLRILKRIREWMTRRNDGTVGLQPFGREFVFEIETSKRLRSAKYDCL
jgi:hypothetical protein